MLVLAPAACILSGIALSEVFGVLTRSLKFQLSKLFDDSSSAVPAVRLLLSLLFLSISLRIGVPFLPLVDNLLFLELKSGDSSTERATNSTKSENGNEKSETAPKEKPSKKNRKKEKEMAESVPVKPNKKEKRLLVLPFELSIMGILLLIVLGGFYVVSPLFVILSCLYRKRGILTVSLLPMPFLQVHCVWAAAEAYSAPSIVLTSRSRDGLHVFDDFREAYAWLSHNTDVDDKVCSPLGSLLYSGLALSLQYDVSLQVASWWDYGYQTTAMANRTVIVDNNTWNNTHIATVGTAMSSPEKAAWEIFNSLDVKYVLVVFGGWCFMAHREKK